jgi:hypothetical protein
MGCDLLMKTEDLRNERYFEMSYDFVKTLTFEMQREFRQTGIFFTDEVQDGQDFDGIRTKDT